MKKQLFFLVFVLLASTLMAQNKQITGNVIDDTTKEPLIGVTIVVKGTSAGTITDSDGKFSLQIPQGKNRIEFSYIGYDTQEVLVGDRTEFHIRLKENTKVLDEVVVVGYGTVKRSDLTGSVTSMKGSDLIKQKSVSFMEGMQGHLAGVQVSMQSGEPGAGTQITIRGANSLNSNTQPLYVIDGVQIDPNNSEVAVNNYESARSEVNPMTSINPADIESIEVL